MSFFQGAVSGRGPGLVDGILMAGGATAVVGGGALAFRQQKKIRELKRIRNQVSDIATHSAAEKKIARERGRRNKALLAALAGLAAAGVGGYRALNAPVEEREVSGVAPVEVITDESYIVSSELDSVDGWQRLKGPEYSRWGDSRVLTDAVFREEDVAHYELSDTNESGQVRIGPDCPQNDLAARIAECRGVQRLGMQGNSGISDIAAIADASAQSLKALWLSRNGLAELPEGIEGMIGLEKLCLDTNRLTSIQRLSALQRLKEKLCLRGNQLTDLSVLARMPDLRAVDAGQNEIRKFDSSWIAPNGNLIRIDVDADVQLPVAWCRRRFLPRGDERPLIVKSGDSIFVSNPYNKVLHFKWTESERSGQRFGDYPVC
ncbi:MAG: Leucinerich repeat [Candidatus Dependentiae bacterium]|nr:Leucinerich repeat [Candidatus Dependentiae bacterium]